MSKVRILTDSGVYLPPDTIDLQQITIVPHELKIGSTLYREEAGFSVDDLFRKLNVARSGGFAGMAKVQAPDINTVYDYYRRLGKEAQQIIAIHTSSHLTPIWQQSRRAAELLMGRHTIRVIDSLSTSLGLGLLVQKAAQAASEGHSVHEIARIVNGSVPHLYVTFFTESLNFLEQSANLGVSQSVLGTMLGIKAMLTVEEGKLIPLEKVQTRDEVVEKLFEFITEFASIEQLGVVHHCYDQAESDLLARLQESRPALPIHRLPYPPSLGALLGPNSIGVIVYEGTF